MTYICPGDQLQHEAATCTKRGNWEPNLICQGSGSASGIHHEKRGCIVGLTVY